MNNKMLAICLSVLFSSAVQAIDIVHPVLRKGSDLDKYASRLIVFLVEKSGETANMKPYRALVNSQSRKEALIASGDISVDWLGADKSREKKLVPIRYPIFRGLLGHRIFITNKEVESQIKGINQKSQLDSYLMIQGEGWADVDVLRSGGFKVKEVANFESIFKMVNAGRADLFPRAVIEPYSEVGSRKSLSNLLVDDKLMVVYKFPMYFFVSPTPENKALVDALNKGFKMAYDDGSFIQFFENDPLVKRTFAEAKLKQRKIFKIDNPHLSQETRQVDAKYWLDL